MSKQHILVATQKATAILGKPNVRSPRPLAIPDAAEIVRGRLTLTKPIRYGGLNHCVSCATDRSCGANLYQISSPKSPAGGDVCRGRAGYDALCRVSKLNAPVTVTRYELLRKDLS
jgi:hypothetical protein